MNYYSCPMIEGHHLVFNGRIDTGGEIASFCCEPIDDIPKTAFANVPEETLMRFMLKRALVIAEGKKYACSSEFEPKHILGCKKCVYYKNSEWQHDGLIHYVNLSMYPAPCQCRCFYCNVYEKDQSIGLQAEEAYEHVFDILEFARECGAIASNARWQVSSGEITIHP